MCSATQAGELNPVLLGGTAEPGHVGEGRLVAGADGGLHVRVHQPGRQGEGDQAVARLFLSATTRVSWSTAALVAQ